MLSIFVLTVLNHDDLPAVAAIHVAAFPDSALTALGVEAVRRYYAWQLDGPHEVFALGVDAVQYDNDGTIANKQLIGYCFAGGFRERELCVSGAAGFDAAVAAGESVISGAAGAGFAGIVWRSSAGGWPATPTVRDKTRYVWGSGSDST